MITIPTSRRIIHIPDETSTIRTIRPITAEDGG